MLLPRASASPDPSDGFLFAFDDPTGFDCGAWQVPEATVVPWLNAWYQAMLEAFFAGTPDANDPMGNAPDPAQPTPPTPTSQAVSADSVSSDIPDLSLFQEDPRVAELQHEFEHGKQAIWKTIVHRICTANGVQTSEPGYGEILQPGLRGSS
jgi:hypothetical protein